MQALRARFGGSPVQVSSDGSTTYGPAVSRLTRTPIDFGPTDGKAGSYDGQRMLVDPSAASVPEVVSHESVHALLTPALLAAATSGPQAQSMLGVMPKFAGDAQAEMPAYLATGEINRLPAGGRVSPSTRAGALSEVIANLARQNPAAARTFNRLVRP